jgi:hypothetical protein
VEIKESRGGFSFVEDVEDVGVGGGFAHSDVMVERSRVPRFLEGESVLVIREGAWISEYAVVASRPA